MIQLKYDFHFLFPRVKLHLLYMHLLLMKVPYQNKLEKIYFLLLKKRNFELLMKKHLKIRLIFVALKNKFQELDFLNP